MKAEGRQPWRVNDEWGLFVSGRGLRLFDLEFAVVESDFNEAAADDVDFNFLFLFWAGISMVKVSTGAGVSAVRKAVAEDDFLSLEFREGDFEAGGRGFLFSGLRDDGKAHDRRGREEEQ
ncbi:MAG TPA: hypothetical protein VG733_19685 [Chthoniobacteraceae bacterium]|nr:hypothetical protein [Chthoniobacteraceae bacterium]